MSALLDLLDALSAFESPNVFNPQRESDSPEVSPITATRGPQRWPAEETQPEGTEDDSHAPEFE